MHLLVTQPYVPAYRIPLFNRVAEILEKSGDSLTVAAGTPSGDQSRRGDDRSAEWKIAYASRGFKIRNHTLHWRTMPKSLERPDVIVSELEALNLFAWSRLLRDTPLVLWGHGKSYVNVGNQLGDRLEWALGKRASHVMTYAQSGRQFLIEKGGLLPNQVTAIGNSTDTTVLRAETVRLCASDQGKDSPPSRALYIGGLDGSKRIDFLLDAADAASHVDPSFHLTVVGRGAMEDHVRDWCNTRRYLTYVPESRGADLARLGHSVNAIWMPGRVGLVAVDALAMGLAVHTTDHLYHAPEIEFLREDEVRVLPNSPNEFAVASLRSMREEQPKLRNDIPTIDSVANAFVQVVRNAWTGSIA